MEHWFLDAELVPDVPVALSGRGELTAGDRAGVAQEAHVVISRSDVPKPTWSGSPSRSARDAREYCLLPLRRQRRSEADAAYWLAEHLRAWADGDVSEAAGRLNVSTSALREMKKLAGRALDRKSAPGNLPLALEERALLARMVEVLVLRLHLYEVGLSDEEYLTLDMF